MTQVMPENFNASLLVMKGGRLALVMEQAPELPIKTVQFNPRNYLIRLKFQLPDGKFSGKYLRFPVDYKFAKALTEDKGIFIVLSNDEHLTEPAEVPLEVIDDDIDV